jgi:hypothetical protein
MIARYPALYRDVHGEEAMVIENDGKTLQMVVRGVVFTGTMFDDFEPTIAQDDPALASFSLYCNSLCSCVIECDMPLPVIFGTETLEELLHMHLELGDPRQNARGGIDQEELQLVLTVSGQTFRSCRKHGWFDDELFEIETALPEGMYLRCCHYCACANYGALGSPLYGGPFCFRDDAALRHAFRSKGDLIKKEIDPQALIVQETFLCPEFAPRGPGLANRP